jgi:branched-chain amino acid transport system substrate-binding protein
MTSLLAAGLILSSGMAFAAGQYGSGVSDTEIKIGNTMPYSGPASALGVLGKSEAAYFGYSPPKTVEMVRQLVEEERVLLLFNTAGTPTKSTRVVADGTRARA